MPYGDVQTVTRLLRDTTVWAVVGLSPDPSRASHGVARFLQQHGKRIVPINPAVPEVLGEPSYPRLADVPAGTGIEVVDVFRRSALAGVHADEAVALGAVGVWFQLGVVDEAAYARTTAAGVAMVMDRCPKIEWPLLGAA